MSKIFKKFSNAFQGEEIRPCCATEVGDDRAEAQKEKDRNHRERKKNVYLLSFSPLMRQEGQKERSAHAQSPRPVPFRMDRRLATPISESKNWVEENIGSSVTKRFWMPSEPRIFNETGLNRPEQIRTVVTWGAQEHHCHPWSTPPCHPSLTSERSVQFIH